MSSTPFCLSVPVLDVPVYKGKETSFVLRAKDKDELIGKIDKFVSEVPETEDLMVYNIGYFPDKPVPVARFFAEIRIREHDIGYRTYHSFMLWHMVLQGRKVMENESDLH